MPLGHNSGNDAGAVGRLRDFCGDFYSDETRVDERDRFQLTYGDLREIAACLTNPAEPSDVRMAMFLEILSTMPLGESDASDGYHSWTNAFCEEHEGRDPDTFNQAIDAGYVHWSHDCDSDNSTIRLTDKGRDFLAMTKGGGNV